MPREARSWEESTGNEGVIELWGDRSRGGRRGVGVKSGNESTRVTRSEGTWASQDVFRQLSDDEGSSLDHSRTSRKFGVGLEGNESPDDTGCGVSM